MQQNFTNWQLKYFALFLLPVLFYSPGITGTFLFDDYATLSQMGQWTSINTFDKWSEFVFGGYAGPTGRPVALMSFTLNGQTWPADPLPFLITNIAIHCINTLLLLCVLMRVFQCANLQSAQWFALVVTAIWSLHPSQVSTVLYVVQRMAMLALMFNLCSILVYLRLREAWLAFKLKSASVYLFIFIVCAILAVCSKENAALLPLQLLLIECLFNYSRGVDSQKRLRIFRWLLVYLPAAVVTVYLIKYLPSYRQTDVGGIRDFTPWQRQLTEFRVLWEYISLFIMPKTQTSGVYHDGYLISKGFLQPINTLFTFVFHAICLVAAYLVRKRWPLIFFGVYWFYFNHLVESSVIQLEIKFEHRNYVPSIGLSVLLAYLLVSLPITKYIRVGLLALIATLLAVATFSRASLWGNPQQAALVWVQENPASVRAIEQAILVHQSVSGHEVLVDQLYDKGVALSENRPMISLKALKHRCKRLSQAEASEQVSTIANQLTKSEVDWQIGGVFEKMLDNITKGNCLAITKAQYQFLIESAISNPKYKRTQVPLQLRLLSILAELRMGDVNKAVEEYQSENYTELPLGLVMTHALWLAVEGQQDVAADILSRSIAQSRQAEDYLKEQAQEMLQKIQNDIRQSYET